MGNLIGGWHTGQAAADPLKFLHDQTRKRHQDLSRRNRRGQRRRYRGRQGRVPLPRRCFRVREVHVDPPHDARGDPDQRRRLGSGQARLSPPELEGPSPAPLDRDGVSGLQAPPNQNCVRERGVCDGGDGEASIGHPQPGAPGAQTRGIVCQRRSVAESALGRRAAARRDRQSVRQPPPDPSRRRADGEPRSGYVGGNHADPRPYQQDGHDGRHGNPRSRDRGCHAQASRPARPRTRDARRVSRHLRGHETNHGRPGPATSNVAVRNGRRHRRGHGAGIRHRPRR